MGNRVLTMFAVMALVSVFSCARLPKPETGPSARRKERYPEIIKKEVAKEALSKIDDAVLIKVFNEGVALLRRGREGDERGAESRFKAVLKKKEGFWPASYNLSYIYLKRRKLSLAEEYINRALEFNKGEKRIYYLLAKIYLDKGELKRAFDLYSEISENFEDTPLAHFNRGNILMRWGEYKNAVDAFNRAGKTTKKYYEISVNKASSYLHLGDYKNAAMTLQSVYDLNIRTRYVLRQYAFSLRKTGSLKDAIRVYNELILFYPDDVDAYKNAGIIYELLLDLPAKAIPLYEKYLENGGKEKASVENWLKIAREKERKKASGNKL